MGTLYFNLLVILKKNFTDEYVYQRSLRLNDTGGADTPISMGNHMISVYLSTINRARSFEKGLEEGFSLHFLFVRVSSNFVFRTI